MQLELKEGDRVSVQHSLDGEILSGEIISIDTSGGICTINIELENGNTIQIKTYSNM